MKFLFRFAKYFQRSPLKMSTTDAGRHTDDGGYHPISSPGAFSLRGTKQENH